MTSEIGTPLLGSIATTLGRALTLSHAHPTSIRSFVVSTPLIRNWRIESGRTHCRAGLVEASELAFALGRPEMITLQCVRAAIEKGAHKFILFTPAKELVL